VPGRRRASKTNNDQLVPLGTADLTGPAAGTTSTTVPPISFYDGTAESLTVSCTASLIAPDGKTPLSVSAKAPQITVLKPTASWGIDPKTMPVNGQATSTGAGFQDNSKTSGSFGATTIWYPVTVSVPSPFSGGQVCFAALPPARAGSYTCTYSGGTFTTDHGDDYQYYLLGDGSYGGSANDDASNTEGKSDPVGATGSGAITATFTWQPDGPGDDPPKSVIVQQYSSVMSEWEGVGPQGGSDDGLGGSPQEADIYDGHGYTIIISTCASTHWTVKSDPGASFTETCSPSAGYTGEEGQDDGMPENSFQAAASVDITYRAVAYPVIMELPGTKKDSSGSANILIGQGCSAKLTSSPCPVSDYNWSVSGTTFQSWTVSSNPANTTYVDGPGLLNIDTPSWYWNDLEPTTKETVSCTATVTPPTGEGAPFTVTATKQVTVMRPDWTATGKGGNMQVNTAFPGGNGSNYWLWAGPQPGAIVRGGMIWNATVTSPNPALFGDGSIAIAQIITPDESYTVLDASQAIITHSEPNNGQTGLDAFPYPWSLTTPIYVGGDAPDFSLDDHMLSAHLASQFVDYLMFQPPGSSQWVPLATFNWGTNGNATRPNSGGWAAFGSGSAGSVTPSGSDVPFTKSNSFPSWTQSDPFIPF